MEIKINLIPPYRKEAILEARRLKLALKLETGILVILILFSAFLFNLNYVLDVNLRMISDDAEFKRNESEYEKVSRLEKTFENVNERVLDIATLKKDQLYWSEVFLILNNTIPENVSLSNIATKNYQVFLAGVADNRDNLIRFKDKLAENSCFSDVNLPLSNLVSKDNVDFQMDLKIKEECVKLNKNK